MKKMPQLSTLPNRYLRLIILTLIVGVFITVYRLQFSTEAQVASQSIEVSPPTQEVAVDPGKTITVKTKLRNNTPKILPISVKIEDFTAQGDEGQVALDGKSKWSVTGWTKVSPSTFKLEGGAEQEVTATITVPKDAAGGRYGSFVFAVDTAKTPNAASVSQEIASLFLLRVSGPVNETVALTSFSAPSFQEFGPVPFSMSFQNNGNVHVKPFGLISVTDMFGNKTADIVVRGANIFPEASRTISSELSKKFLFGQYHANLVMYYGSTNQTLTGSTSFIVFPVRIAGGILVILIILFLLRKRLRKAGKALLG